MAPCAMTKTNVRDAIQGLDATKLPAGGAKVDEQRCALRKVLAAKHGVGGHADLAAFLAHIEAEAKAAGAAAVAALEHLPSAAAAPVHVSAAQQLEQDAADGVRDAVDEARVGSGVVSPAAAAAASGNAAASTTVASSSSSGSSGGGGGTGSSDGTGGATRTSRRKRRRTSRYSNE